jgi:hypothetical protein
MLRLATRNSQRKETTKTQGQQGLYIKSALYLPPRLWHCTGVHFVSLFWHGIHASLEKRIRNVTMMKGTGTPNKRPTNRWVLYRSMVVVFTAAGITWTFASCINFQPEPCECLQGNSNPSKVTQVTRNQEQNLELEPYNGPSRVFT